MTHMKVVTDPYADPKGPTSCSSLNAAWIGAAKLGYNSGNSKLAWKAPLRPRDAQNKMALRCAWSA